MNEEKIWSDDPQYEEFFNFPVSVIESSNGMWVAAFNKKSEEYLGKDISAVAQGKTKEEAIKNLFFHIQFLYYYLEECRRSYQRFVPIRFGNWKHTGGRWIVIFGINIYFRYGKNMKYGFYIPFTKLNIRINNEWIEYNRFKKETKNKKL